MKSRVVVAAVMLIGLALGLVASGDAPSSQAAPLAQAADPLTLNLNLAQDPLTLDPALAVDTASTLVIEQLFIGLVDLDDQTGAVQPELAENWTISPDGTVYTFTLRGDGTWSDGQPITAQDMRYGILRTLAPATGSAYASVLDMIKNAREYRTGAITDPEQVGVTVLDNTHLQITLQRADANLLSVLAMWVARPMPQSTIEAWGGLWTDPAHIVTSGPYRLARWTPGDHILLEKSPTYSKAANVQIEQVKIWIVDAGMAWNMYLNGNIDTATVPADAVLNAALRQEMRIEPVACTYYYGFNISQPPFENTLVRKAFIAAVNRRGLIEDVLGGAQRPALTFTSPGVFGYVDGYAEGVGIPYNPAQAQQWLAQAGYPGGQGLPPITVWYNTSAGHQAIADHIRQDWNRNLGVEVEARDIAWSDYLGELNRGQFQVWRLGWCADYLDALNFLRDALSSRRGALGGWMNSTYEGLLDQAAQTSDPDTRKALYKQAERILVETDAVMLPLYYYGAFVATKPYLERTYPVGGQADIAAWRITRVSGTANPATGGTLVSYHGDTTVQIPAGAFADPVELTQAPATEISPGGNLRGIGHTFDITAVNSDTGQPAQPVQSCRITVRYTKSELGSAIENTLGLYYWEESQWVREASSVLDTATNTVSATPNHLSLWSVLGETRRNYLPILGTR